MPARYTPTRDQRLWCAVILFSLIVGPLAAQHQQLFGRWLLEPGQDSVSAAPQTVTVRQSLTRTMERGPMKPFFRDITIERAFKTGIRSETYQIGVAGEQLPSVKEDGTPNRVIDHFVRFEGQSLIIESGSELNKTPKSDGRQEHREAWEIEPDGRLKLTITTRTANAPPETVTYMYRRQGSADVRRLP
jgi:hypothetical protein